MAAGSEGNQQMNFMNQTIEQLSIFQNKDLAQFRNVDPQGTQIKPQEPSLQDRKYVKKLELSVENLNTKLSKLKVELQRLKDENLQLKASNDNHIYINEKLNKALKKQLDKKADKKKKKKGGEDETIEPVLEDGQRDEEDGIPIIEAAREGETVEQSGTTGGSNF